MLLSDTAVLVYVLRRSGCVGRLAVGRIERDGPVSINVYTALGINPYISGDNLRSWCVVGTDRRALVGWEQVTAEDRPRLYLVD